METPVGGGEWERWRRLEEPAVVVEEERRRRRGFASLAALKRAAVVVGWLAEEGGRGSLLAEGCRW